MTLRLRITTRATREIERADAWWRENRLSAPGAVREDLKSAFNLLLQNPDVGAKVVTANMYEAIQLHVEGMLEDGLSIPEFLGSCRIHRP